ncbi:MAG: DNA-binding protein, partial [Bacteroidaceae bacterium]|nr:DNA-binding protein [Bacteroidaceae bacterium]
MAKKEIERLEKRIELLEMQIKELKSVEPDVINQRFKSIEEALYSTKDILNMKEVCQYLDISQSLLYKLTCNGEIPH